MESLHAEDPVSVGPFRLIGRLGVGGMGRVFLARSAGGRTVAVKVVHAELAAQDEFRRRFAREVAALERVGGTGTAPVLGSDTTAESPWVAIGYVPGPSLRTVVGDEFGPLPPATVRALASGLARALDHIHAAGLVHRDLKPSNVLLTVDGPRIIDFGIARAVDHVAEGGDLTTTGAVVGSPGFMSPEQVRGDQVSPASDVFCLGSVLAYAATGRAPFGTADSGVHATMFRIAHDEPDLTDLPPELSGLIRACLAKDPAARPTATEIVETLPVADPWLPADVLARLGRHAAQLLEAEGSSAPPVSETPPPPTGAASPTPTAPAAPRRRGRTALLAAVTALVVVAAAGVAYTYWPKSGGTTGGGGKNGTTGPTRAAAGIVPAAFLGAWEGVLKGKADAPYETSRIEITQGAAGAKAAVYTHVTGEQLCIGRATLISATDSELVLGEAEITESVPAQRCTPAARQTLTLRSTDVVEWGSGVARATFQRVKAGADVVPAAYVGRWKQAPDTVTQPDPDRWTYEVTITQGPVGAPLVRFEQAYPRTDDEGNPLSGTVRCATTAVVGGAGSLLVIGPETRDPDTWDPDCVENGSSNLRIVRYQGKDRLQSYGMSADGEPAEFVRD
ncbi:serine/threonine-protein kinase [Streptomyces vietnamensis]|uniref:Serine/threonine protein kinase n=1 Tax=Streptomyces vietnamensis TaxID=362257 RepID=A0A0B5HV73_9ACTN|nr:serine/threonine-protein kinase [Streptomyces vietnamensis]AJF65930.1 serine/threonine protein kinase [Streptomyces vietnamensis]